MTNDPRGGSVSLVIQQVGPKMSWPSLVDSQGQFNHQDSTVSTQKSMMTNDLRGGGTASFAEQL